MSLRPVQIILAVVAGLLMAVGLLVWAFSARPFGLNHDDVIEVSLVAVERTVDPELVEGSGPLYVRSEVGEPLLERLKSKYPRAQVRDWKERPPDHGCESDDSYVISMPCARPDFVSVAYPTNVLWRTVLITAGTFSGGCEFLLFEGIDRWWILSESCLVA